MINEKYIQYPNYNNSYNRYSYCLNNPVNFTDTDANISKNLFVYFSFKVK